MSVLLLPLIGTIRNGHSINDFRRFLIRRNGPQPRLIIPDLVEQRVFAVVSLREFRDPDHSFADTLDAGNSGNDIFGCARIYCVCDKIHDDFPRRSLAQCPRVVSFSPYPGAGFGLLCHPGVVLSSLSSKKHGNVADIVGNNSVNAYASKAINLAGYVSAAPPAPTRMAAEAGGRAWGPSRQRPCRHARTIRAISFHRSLPPDLDGKLTRGASVLVSPRRAPRVFSFHRSVKSRCRSPVAAGIRQARTSVECISLALTPSLRPPSPCPIT
jgi:hypothetical protein